MSGTAIVESGCIGHFLLINTPCRNTTKYINPLRLRLPNGATMDSTHKSSLNIPELIEAASVAHVSQPWQTTPSFQSENFTMKVTMSLLKLTASQFSMMEENPS
jgi:hypothetical protein